MHIHKFPWLLNRQHGFAYVWMLSALILLAIAIGQWAANYATLQQRSKELELLRIGIAYKNAIERFYLASPGDIKNYPIHLDDLLKDPRKLAITRYLRKLEKDPLTQQDFVIIRNADQQIIGVYSKAAGDPIKQRNFPSALKNFTGTGSYEDWKFIAR